ncbi:MAG: hypothetical protein PF484_14245 [Bacteroidales bacterium]|jgi:hypothetical protein|nr:hypothetical protein [Bacteroidales bacterium]
MKKLTLLILITLFLPASLFAEEHASGKQPTISPPVTQENHTKKAKSENASKEEKTSIQTQNKTIENNNDNSKNKDLDQREKSKIEVAVVQEKIELRVAEATEWNAYATIAIAILTIILAIETVRLRLIQAKQIKHLSKESIKPKIELYLETNKYSINFIEIHVVSNGNGTANNIRFFFEAEENEAIETSRVIISKIEKINFFKIGLRYLGAGQSKKSFLMSATENELGGNDIFFKSIVNAKIICEDDLGEIYTYKYTFDMSEFQGITTIGSEPTKDIADNLKKISDSFTSVVGTSAGKKRIQTDMFDDSSRVREEQEMREWREKQKKI